MENAKTFFGIIGLVIQNCLRYLINLGRRQPIISAIYLIVFCLVLINIGNQPVSPPTPTPPSSSSPPPPPSSSNLPNAPLSPDSSYPASTPSAPPAPSAVAVANVKAYRNGDFLTVRFDKPVANIQILVDEQSVKANCEDKICTAAISQQALQAQVSWSQGSESFTASFRL